MYDMMYDIIIVGGGPAGSSAARRAAELGLKVICLEKSKMPREKPCGGGLSRSAFSVLSGYESSFDSYSAGEKFFGPLNEKVEPDGLQSGAFVIRPIFDQQLLLAAQKAGAEVKEEERVNDIHFLNDSVIAVTSKQEYEGRVIFGADGVNSIVAKCAGLKSKWKPDEVAFVYVNETEVGEAVMDKYYSPHRKVIFHLAFSDTVGYGWVFPKKRHVNVGFGGIMAITPNVKEKFQRYVKKCQAEGLLPEIDPANTTAHLIPICGPLHRVYMNRVLLLGDAGGFVNPTNGEGIHYAIRTGIAAAETVAEIIRHGIYQTKCFKMYQDRCMREFGKDLRWLKIGHKFAINRISRLLDYSQRDLGFGKLLFNMMVSSDLTHKWVFIRKYLGMRLREIFGTLPARKI